MKRVSNRHRAVDGRFTLLFALPPFAPEVYLTLGSAEACVKFITDKVTAAGWNIHWPEWDYEECYDSDGEYVLKHVLEISLSIDDMHHSAEEAINRARREASRKRLDNIYHMQEHTI